MKIFAEYGCKHLQPIPSGPNGEVIMKPFLKGPPKILLKNSQSPISLSFQFECPLGTECVRCSISPRAKAEYQSKNMPLPNCEYARRVQFVDSCLHLHSSLASCVSDLHDVAKSTNTPLENLFESTYAFSNELKYSHAQFEILISAKMKFPFALCTDIATLKSYSTIPPKEFFHDKLSNRSNIDEDAYQTFCTIWNCLKFESLLQCLWIYSLLDRYVFKINIKVLRINFL